MHEKIEELLEQPWFAPTVAGVLGFCGGLGVGFMLGKRRKETLMIDESNEQLSIDFNVYDAVKIDELPAVEKRTRPPKVVIPAEVAGIPEKITTVTKLSDLRTSMLSEDEVEEVEEAEEDEAEEDELNIIVPETTEDVEWNYEEEIASRDPGVPYVIHQEEFFADEMGLAQMTLTYYAIDDIMADEDEKPVYNHRTVVGELKFGHGSGDADTFYVRNEKRHAEYEIIRLNALYSVEVLGLEIEDNQRVADLKHSKSLKFRMD